ncbi:sugar porter family MFS transporter [Halochromatium sp.]
MTTTNTHFAEAYKSATAIVRKVAIVAFIGALGGLLFGLDQGFINGSLPLIQKDMGLSTDQAAFFSSVLAWAAAVGAFIAGWVARALGRKNTILIAALAFAACTLVGATAQSYEILLASRLLLGLAVGTAAFVVPLYLSEISPTHMRGGIIAMYQLMITIGIFLVFVSNATVEKAAGSDPGSWRLMLAIISIPAILMLLAGLSLPRSPRWLLLRQHREQARAVLEKTRASKPEIDHEINEIESSLAKGSNGFQLFSQGFFWKVLLLGIALQALQQLSGINSVIYYSTEIFDRAGISNAAVATVIVGFVNMVTTLLAVAFVDRLGRKPILYLGLTLMALTLLAVGLVFQYEQGGGVLTETDQVLTVAVVLLYIFAFAISLGPIVWIICAEIFPLEGREIGITITTIANWVFAASVVQGSEIVLQGLGGAVLFYFFAACCVIGLGIVFLFTPETRRVSLEDMEMRLRDGVRLKRIGV